MASYFTLSLGTTVERLCQFNHHLIASHKLAVIFVLISLTAGFATITHAWDGSDVEQLKDYSSYISQKEEVSVSLLQGIIKAESGWQKDAHNPVGTASGILQFLNSTFQNYCITKYHFANSMEQKDNPFIQINCAVEMLKEPKGYRNWLESMPSWQLSVL